MNKENNANNGEGKPFMDSIFGKILIGVIGVIVAFVMYAGWVNSGAHDENFFGMAFRLPLESKDHYCWRKSHLVLTTNTSRYNQCMKEE